jgi:hypothetical protein
MRADDLDQHVLGGESFKSLPQLRPTKALHQLRKEYPARAITALLIYEIALRFELSTETARNRFQRELFIMVNL